MGVNTKEVEYAPMSQGMKVSEGKASRQEGSPLSCLRNGTIDYLGPIEVKKNFSTYKLSVMKDDVVDTMNVFVLNSTAANAHGECETSGKEMVRRYWRGKLEVMRFANVDEQQKKWHEMYQSLDFEVVQQLTVDCRKKMNSKQEQSIRWERKDPIGGKSTHIITARHYILNATL